MLSHADIDRSRCREECRGNGDGEICRQVRQRYKKSRAPARGEQRRGLIDAAAVAFVVKSLRDAGLSTASKLESLRWDATRCAEHD